METIQYQLEEKLGSGKWQRVYETKVEANYESPVYKTFRSAEEARQYANTDTQRWAAGALNRGVVRVVMVTTQVQVLSETPPESHHYHGRDAMLALRYPDSLFDVRLFLTDDGRKRGLWIWLEENWKIRWDNDLRIFEEDLKRFVQHLKEEKFDLEAPTHLRDLAFALRLHFDYFFGHRTEAAAIRLSWLQVKKLAAALEAGHAAETQKTEDYNHDFDAEADEEDEAAGED